MNKNQRYIVDPPVSTSRLKRTAYEKADKITSKWIPVQRPNIELCSNVRSNFNPTTKKFLFNPSTVGMYQVISSALLLYRLLCLFKASVETEGPAGYKCTWCITLKHKESGEYLMLGE